MGYGDYVPTGSNHRKKPLTKAQIRKIQENYSKAEEISKKIKEAEELEKNNVSDVFTQLF